MADDFGNYGGLLYMKLHLAQLFEREQVGNGEFSIKTERIENQAPRAGELWRNTLIVALVGAALFSITPC